MALLCAAKPPPVDHVLDSDFAGAVGGIMFYYEILSPEDGGDARNFRVRRMTSGGEEDPATGSAACAFGVWMSQKALSQGTANGRKFGYVIEQGVEMGRVGSFHSQDCIVVC